MSKTHRKELPEQLLPERPLLPEHKPKPRQVKRLRQWEAMQPPPVEFPQNLEPVTFKPMG